MHSCAVANSCSKDTCMQYAAAGPGVHPSRSVYIACLRTLQHAIVCLRMHQSKQKQLSLFNGSDEQFENCLACSHMGDGGVISFYCTLQNVAPALFCGLAVRALEIANDRFCCALLGFSDTDVTFAT